LGWTTLAPKKKKGLEKKTRHHRSINHACKYASLKQAAVHVRTKFTEKNLKIMISS